MKKLVITLACMLTLGAIQAQEVEKFFVDFKKISIFAKGMVADNST